MPELKYAGGTVSLDRNGYLKNINAWSESVAAAIAKKEGIKKLTEDHLEVIRFLRTYYIKFNSFPLIRMVCTNLHRPTDCMSKPFRMDPLKAWKIAGLPQPGEETVVYLSGPPHPEK
ncbi:MAG TPA: TusE/DsrC/DsvC family sulfur relay protein [Nitrospirota bacterium]|nr:TusE/DsrC/DsvC family sulfur relay protein [Nitrospirota bacterium]